VRVLVGSKDEYFLEQMGLDLTDMGLVPLFCDDAQAVISTIRDQHLGIQILLIEQSLMDEDDQLLINIRNVDVDQYVYIVVLGENINQTIDLHWRRIGADQVLDKRLESSIFQVHLQVAARMIEHQTKQKLLQQSLWNQANYDPLTEISNRRSILRFLTRQSEICFQRQDPLGVLMIDLDFFKRVNDTYGHDCGDVVLKESANRMKKSIRNSDLVGRFGGEEFLVVTPSCSGEELIRLAERIRVTLKNSILYKHSLIPLSASIGVAVHYPDDDDVLHSLKMADQALYVAKEMGRDRVVCSWMLDEYTARTG
jgi:diguanylate cyclase (GGDEF)-like protein